MCSGALYCGLQVWVCDHEVGYLTCWSRVLFIVIVSSLSNDSPDAVPPSSNSSSSILSLMLLHIHACFILHFGQVGFAAWFVVFPTRSHVLCPVIFTWKDARNIEDRMQLTFWGKRRDKCTWKQPSRIWPGLQWPVWCVFTVSARMQVALLHASHYVWRKGLHDSSDDCSRVSSCSWEHNYCVQECL